MRSWTLEKAKNGFSEVVRLALDHQPQLVTRGRRGEAVVVIARADYERLVAPPDLFAALQDSPMAAAIRDGAFDEAAPPEAVTPARGQPRDLGFD